MTVLVTVVGPRSTADLVLDDARPVHELMPELAVALGESAVATALRAPDGRPIPGEVTLAEARVMDGHRLRLVTAAPPPPEAHAAADAENADLTAGSRGAIMPVYLALDTSDSMSGPVLQCVNTELSRLVDAVRADPRLADTCHLGVVTFDADARVALPLTPVADLHAPPRLAATRPATNYEAVFRLLRDRIGRDLESLRSAGRQPRRPAVFLLSDGRPTRGFWPGSHAELTDRSWPDAPDVVAFGFGDASELAVRRIGTAGAFLPARVSGRPAVGPAGMLATFMDFLVDAVARTVRPAATEPSRAGSGTPVPTRPPDPPAGWRSLHELHS